MAFTLPDGLNTPMRALILDADSSAGLEVLQSLGRARVRVDACCQDSDCLAFKSRYPYRRLPQPSPSKGEEFIGWLRSIDERNDYTLIVPATEFSLLAFRKLPETDPLRFKAVLPPDGALDAALDKQKTVDLALELGIPVPHTIEIASADEIVPAGSFPLVLKPARTMNAIEGRLQVVSAALVHNETTRRDYLRAWLPYVPVLQQAYIPGHGVGIEVLFDRGREIWHFAHERLHEIPLTGGGSSYRRSIKPPQGLHAAAKKFLEVLRWHGVAMAEFRVQPDGEFYLMEINPRLWGSLALAIDAGVDFPLGLLRIAAGEQTLSQPAYREGYYTRNFKNDIEWLKANFRAGRRNPFLLTRPRVASVLEYLRPFSGRESWDHFDVRDLAVTGSVLAGTVAENMRRASALLRRGGVARKIVKNHQRRYSRAAGTRPEVRRILFLCHGNICRSPFAEAVARKKLAGYDIESAGFHSAAGRPTPNDVVRIAHFLGADIATARSKRLVARQVEEADLILLMDLENYQLLANQFPEALPKATLLGLFASPPIPSLPDPYAMTEVEKTRVLEQIYAAVEGLSDWLYANQAGVRETSHAIRLQTGA